MKKSILLGAFALFLSSGSVFAEDNNTFCAEGRNDGKEVPGETSQPKEEGTSSNAKGEPTPPPKDQ